MKLQVMHVKSEAGSSPPHATNNTAEFIKSTVNTNSGVGVKYLFQSYQQQLEPTQHFTMSHEEARRLKGLVAKTRALFESAQRQHPKASTPTQAPPPQTTSDLRIRQSLSANNVSQFKLSQCNGNPTYNETCHDSDKENGNNFYHGVKLKSTTPRNFNYRSSYGEPEVIYSNAMQSAKSATLYNENESLMRPSFLKLKKPGPNKSSIVFDNCTGGKNECRTFFRRPAGSTVNGSAHRPIVDSATQTDFSSAMRPRRISPKNFTTPDSKYLSMTRQQSPAANNELWKKSEEISRELNIPLSVKQAKMCFETLAMRAADTRNSESAAPRPTRFVASARSPIRPQTATATTKTGPKHVHMVTSNIVNTDQDEVNLLLSSSSSSTSSSSSASTHHSNIILSTTSSSSSSSPSETSSSSVVFNSQTSSSCETTPRSSAEVSVKVSTPSVGEANVKPTSVANKIRRLEEKYTTSKENSPLANGEICQNFPKSPTSNTSVVFCSQPQVYSTTTTTSSFNQIVTNPVQTQIVTPVKYIQSPKFLQLYQKQMEVKSVTGYRKLEDIVNEAERSSGSSPAVVYFKTISDNSESVEGINDKSNLGTNKDVPEEKETKKQLKSILRKVPKSESMETGMANMIFSSNSGGDDEPVKPKHDVKFVKKTAETITSPTRPLSEIYETSHGDFNTPLVKVDNSSCVLPSKLKLRERSQSLGTTNNNVIFSSVSCSNKTPSESTTQCTNVGGTFIKNSNYSSIGSSTSQSNGGNGTGLLAKRANRSAMNAREGLIRWCRKMTDDYDNVCITNFSSSWSDGLAFCALLHHFMPDAFDYSQLDPENRRFNFELAFKVAEEKAGIVSLLDVNDMIEMGNSPDWKCVFTYVHSIYQRFKDE